ncbi:MAG: hypothetical protein JW889_01070 [Verrucomicrobia bacterium]|nr:hypothetical protein [Verrucomicrobiota bacterium]
MEIREDQLAEIRNLAEYRKELQKLRSSATGSVAFGALAVLGGLRGLDESPVSAVLAVIGTLLIIAGVWQLTSPSLSGIVVNALALFLVGAWNVWVSVYNMRHGGGEMGGRWFVLGVVQIGWGIESLVRHRRLSRVFPQEPSKETVRLVDELITTLRAAKPKQAENVVEFTAKPFVGPPEHYRGPLMPGLMVLASKRHAVLCGAKDEVRLEITPRQRRRRRRTYKAALIVAGDTHKGTMSRESLERFEAWKAAAGSGAAAAASPAPVGAEAIPPSPSGSRLDAI